MRRRLAILILGALVVAGCSLLTKAYDYQVGPPETDGGAEPDADAAPVDTRACAFCPRADLAHAPCGTSDASTDGGAPITYVVTSVSFGADRATWTDPAYAAGLDQDCSERPEGGAPATCAPSAGSGPFVALPRGVDNALATQVIAPMKDSGGDLQANVDAWLAQGAGGIAIVVGDWNGLPDDDRVTVRVLSVASTDDAGAHAYDEGSEPTSASAYVTGGVLVAQFDKQVTFRFGATFGASCALLLARVVGSGRFTTSELPALTIAGELNSNGQRGLGFEQSFAELAYGCAVDGGTQAQVERWLNVSYDLPAGGNTCFATSAGMLARARRAAFGGFVDPRGVPASCP